MSFVKILVHVVWGTKYREPTLVKQKREVFFEHIRENAKEKKIHIVSLGGYTDHVHCLISMTKDESIAKIVQLLKGESSNWANKRNLFPTKLIWAEDYFAASISAGATTKVKAYIENQDRHHSKMTSGEEYNRFKLAHGFELNEE